MESTADAVFEAARLTGESRDAAFKNILGHLRTASAETLGKWKCDYAKFLSSYYDSEAWGADHQHPENYRHAPYEKLIMGAVAFLLIPNQRVTDTLKDCIRNIEAGGTEFPQPNQVTWRDEQLSIDRFGGTHGCYTISSRKRPPINDISWELTTPNFRVISDDVRNSIMSAFWSLMWDDSSGGESTSGTIIFASGPNPATLRVDCANNFPREFTWDDGEGFIMSQALSGSGVAWSLVFSLVERAFMENIEIPPD
jgi:hypothetical protein